MVLGKHWRMKWKVWSSYFYEYTVEKKSSEHNPSLIVTLKNGRFLLNTPRAVYSYEDNYVNFAEAIKSIGPDRFRSKDVLLLGLGMASIPFIFEKRHDLKLDYTAVEIDAEVIALCKKYALPLLESSIDIHHQDAYDWVVNSRQKYGAVMMDVFVDDVTPARFMTSNFLEHLESLLLPDGYLLFNLLFSTKVDRAKSKEYLDTVFLKKFPTAEAVRAAGNLMLIYHKK